jgi:tRNA threonylcarbamoyladenosine biosynthesis protein TsaB
MSTFILQLETSTEVCSCAISKNGVTIHTTESIIANSHTEILTLLIIECLAVCKIKMTDLSALAFSHGPGSYTSLRVGASTAKALCYASNLKLIAIDSLQILAAGITTKVNVGELIIPMIDARRMEVYLSIYDPVLSELIAMQAAILDKTTLDDLLKGTTVSKIHICGSGAKKFYEAFHTENLEIHHLNTSANYMSRLAFAKYQSFQYVDVAYYTPEYLKSPKITKSLRKYF